MIVLFICVAVFGCIFLGYVAIDVTVSGRRQNRWMMFQAEQAHGDVEFMLDAMRRKRPDDDPEEYGHFMSITNKE